MKPRTSKEEAVRFMMTLTIVTMLMLMLLMNRFGWLAELAANPPQGSTGSGAGVVLTEFFQSISRLICDAAHIVRDGEVLSPEESPSSAEWTRGSRLHSLSVPRYFLDR